MLLNTLQNKHVSDIMDCQLKLLYSCFQLNNLLLRLLRNIYHIGTNLIKDSTKRKYFYNICM